VPLLRPEPGRQECQDDRHHEYAEEILGDDDDISNDGEAQAQHADQEHDLVFDHCSVPRPETPSYARLSQCACRGGRRRGLEFSSRWRPICASTLVERYTAKVRKEQQIALCLPHEVADGGYCQPRGRCGTALSDQGHPGAHAREDAERDGEGLILGADSAHVC
jgi:hypothetical protein